MLPAVLYALVVAAVLASVVAGAPSACVTGILKLGKLNLMLPNFRVVLSIFCNIFLQTKKGHYRLFGFIDRCCRFRFH